MPACECMVYDCGLRQRFGLDVDLVIFVGYLAARDGYEYMIFLQ